MLLILIIALIATPAFFRQAKCMGIRPGKVACIPFVAAGMLLVIANLTALAISEVSRRASVSDSTVFAIEMMMNVFLILAYLALIRRCWMVMDGFAPSNSN
jgi:hypothetical protein